MVSVEPLPVAIAGFGWWGQHIARRLENNERIAIRGIAETDQSRHEAIRARGLTVYPEFDAAIADPAIRAVVLTTPHLLHEEQVVAAAAAGKHVFCEKPLALNSESARRSVSACVQAGVQLGVGHERRFEPAMKALKAEIDSGNLGVIMHAEAAFSHDRLAHVEPGDWRTLKIMSPAAGMTGMGVHLTDLLISFFGRVETVQAMTASRSLRWETGDVVTVQLGFQAGMTASLSAILHTPDFVRMHVFGSRKWIEVRGDTHPDTPDGEVRTVEAETGRDPKVSVTEWTDSVVENLEAFRAAALGETPYPITPEEMIHNIEVLEAVTRSAENRETIQIPSPCVRCRVSW